MRVDARREFERAFREIDAAYAELRRLGGRACEGFSEEGGCMKCGLGTYEGYDITLSVGDGGSQIYAATNCHYPSLYILSDRLPELYKAAENLRKEVKRLEEDTRAA
ncbi:MAG: hypothetical protein NT016_01455 [Candidatus Aenigmarchaeota archaeon]|nr:hypothetical protein [Candidatus Aenigmarchaeota archaeon]